MLVSLLWIGDVPCSPFIAQDPYNFPPSTCQTVQYLNILHEVTYNVDGDFTLQLSVEMAENVKEISLQACIFLSLLNQHSTVFCSFIHI